MDFHSMGIDHIFVDECHYPNKNKIQTITYNMLSNFSKLSSIMIITNRQTLSNCRQRSVSSIEESVSTGIILRSDPFPFHHPPQSFGNIQMRGIGRQIEKKKSPFLPYWAHLFHLFTSMNGGVIKYNKCLFYEPEGKAIEKADNLPGINRLIGRKSFKIIISLLVIPKMLSLLALPEGI